MTLNEILIRRRHKLAAPPSSGESNREAAVTFNLNLQPLGYTLSPEALTALSFASLGSLTAVAAEVILILKKLRGVARYTPMYPNFPQQVIEATDAELYINAMIHYFTAWVYDITGGATKVWLPKYKKLERVPLDEKIELTVLDLADENEPNLISRQIATSNTSISASDKDDLRFLISHGYFVLPEAIPNKENMAVVAAEVIRSFKPGNTFDVLTTADQLFSMFRTATDVLRLAVAISDGDVSLAKVTVFTSFSRKIRRTLLFMFERCGTSFLEDMGRRRARFLRLGERLHPGEYKDEYPKTFEAFTTLREGRVRTFNSKIEVALTERRITDAVRMLATRPGDLTRRLDKIVRMSGDLQQAAVLDAFIAGAMDVSTPVLLQAGAHFRHRTSPIGWRTFFPKGEAAKLVAIADKLPWINADVCQRIWQVCDSVLVKRFGALPSLGKVFLDPDLQTYFLPFSQRSASDSLRTLVRGSRIKFMPEKGTIRFFIYWHDAQHSRTDLDLSAVYYGEDWHEIGAVNFHNLRAKGVYHSGDITSAPNGACEFIDVDMNILTDRGARYVAMMVNSFSGQPLKDVREAKAGWMLRQKPQSGEVFDARTVVDRIDLTGEAQQMMPMVIDIIDRNIIWTDMAIKHRRGRANEVFGNLNSIQAVAKAISSLQKPTMFDLLRLHSLARSTELVSSPDAADTVFTPESIAYDVSRIASEFMVDAVPATVTVSAPL